MDRPAAPAARIRAVLASPLVHFFALGGLVFALYALMNPAAEQPPRDDVLRLSEAEAQRLTAEFISTRQRAPTPEELRLLIRDWAIEEATVREALALGLDQGDAMVRNRLRSKIEFLAEAPAAGLTPDDATLDAYYRANAARFGRDGQVSFEQVLLPAGAGPDQVQAVRAELEQGADPGTLSSSAMLPAQVDAMPAPAVERVFGPGFGGALARLPLDRWSGPVQSGFGAHLVRIERRDTATLPPLDAVRDRVLADWRIQEARRMRDAYIETLMGRFTLELPDLAEAEAGQ